MKSIHRALLMVFLLSLLMVWTGCDLIFPYSASNMTTYAPYRATAQIYRPVWQHDTEVIEFTETWQMYGWPPPEDRDQDGNTADDFDDIVLYFQGHLQEYISHYMAPGFPWQYRNLNVVSDTEKKAGGDCLMQVPPLEPPLSFGAPIGAEIVWTNPDSEHAYAWCQLFYEDGTNGIALPPVTKAVMRFAERSGFSDFWTGDYDPSLRHLRFSDMYLEFGAFSPDNCPSNCQVTDAFVQNFGTAFARSSAPPPTLYRLNTDDDAVFFQNISGSVSGTSGSDKRCFNNALFGDVTERQNSSPVFNFLLDGQVTDDSGNTVADFLFELHSPEGTLFAKHQPQVELNDETTTNRTPTLGPATAFDNDNDLAPDRFLWFEDFEKATEIFLGKGQTVSNLTYSLGEHKITVVAYDYSGAYNTASMTLDITTMPPVAICQNVTASAGASCTAAASVDNGSYDPDGDSLTYSQTPAAPYPLGETLVTLEVADPEGGTDSCTATVTVEDLMPPTVNCPTDRETATDAGTCSAVVSFSPTGSDNCGLGSVVSTPASGSTFAAGSTSVTVTATDTSDNTAQCTFNVVVIDQEPPTIVCPANVTANATSPSGAVATFPAPTASDNCPVSTACVPPSASTFAIGTTSVTCTADDGSNTATCGFTVKIKSAAEQAADLIAMVQGLVAPKLDPGVRNAMLVKLQLALASINTLNKPAACQALLDFINMVKAQSGKKISTSAATQLINDATRIRAVLGC